MFKEMYAMNLKPGARIYSGDVHVSTVLKAERCGHFQVRIVYIDRFDHQQLPRTVTVPAGYKFQIK